MTSINNSGNINSSNNNNHSSKDNNNNNNNSSSKDNNNTITTKTKQPHTTKTTTKSITAIPPTTKAAIAVTTTTATNKIYNNMRTLALLLLTIDNRMSSCMLVFYQMFGCLEIKKVKGTRDLSKPGFHFVIIVTNKSFSPLRNSLDVNLFFFSVFKPVIVDCTHVEIFYYMSHFD